MASTQWPEAKLAADAVNQAAEVLHTRRRAGLAGPILPAAMRPRNIADAFAIQQCVAAMMGDVIGWKCGLSRMDEHNGLQIVAAPLYQSELSQWHQCSIWPSKAGLARVEPEFAYPLLRDITAKTDVTGLCVSTLFGQPRLAFELIASRFHADAGADYFDQLADGLFNQGLWLGPLVQGAASLNSLWQSRSYGVALLKRARHPNNDPALPLLPFVQMMQQRGIGLRRGQWLITGSFCGVLSLPLGELLEFSFAGQATQSIEFITR